MNREYIPLKCQSCFGNLPENGTTCEYCGTCHAPVERYSGPSIPEDYAPLMTFDVSNISTSNSYSSSITKEYPPGMWREA